ncbi:MAG TPA: roadblock/LC7 domain-containing protein [Kineosporiaceae bacterium]|nr:roadblock/LC7 domain-containing protein [Kineosporiaceae bacterium]
MSATEVDSWRTLGGTGPIPVVPAEGTARPARAALPPAAVPDPGEWLGVAGSVAEAFVDPGLLLAGMRDPRIPVELAGLRERLPGAEAVLVATLDGMVLAHEPAGGDVLAAGRLATALLVQGRQATLALGRGRFRNSLVWGSDGYVAVYTVGQEALLLVLADACTNVGSLHVESRAAARAIADLLGG